MSYFDNAVTRPRGPGWRTGCAGVWRGGGDDHLSQLRTYPTIRRSLRSSGHCRTRS